MFNLVLILFVFFLFSFILFHSSHQVRQGHCRCWSLHLLATTLTRICISTGLWCEGERLIPPVGVSVRDFVCSYLCCLWVNFVVYTLLCSVYSLLLMFLNCRLSSYLKKKKRKKENMKNLKRFHRAFLPELQQAN